MSTLGISSASHTTSAASWKDPLVVKVVGKLLAGLPGGGIALQGVSQVFLGG
jgi:hypothetical protein